MKRQSARTSVCWSVAALIATTAAATAQIQLGSPVAYPSGPDPRDIAAADFDADGRVDLAATVASPARVSLLRGQGDGTFAAPFFFALPADANAVCIVSPDLDCDGLPEIVVAASGRDEILILHNLGDWNFVALPAIPVGDEPRELVAADLDGDGDLDLAVTNRAASTVTTVRNLGCSEFEVIGTLTVGASPRSLAVGSLFSENHNDVAIAAHDCFGVCLLRNPGDGDLVLVTMLDVPGDASPESVVVADMNGDGLDDIVTCFSEAMVNKVGVYDRTGAGTFAAPRIFNVGSTHPADVVAVDLDLDTRLDLALITSDTNRMAVLRQLENGQFGMNVQFDLPTGHSDHMIAADLDLDHFVDLVCANSLGSSVSVVLNGLENPWNYCLAAPNSAGEGAHLSASGPPSASAGKLTLSVTGAPQRTIGLFLFSHTPTLQARWQGYLCLAAPVQRIAPVLQTDFFGNVSLRLPAGGPLPDPMLAVITADSVWNFQFWYRDVLPTGRAVTNTSNGLRVYFEP